MDYIVADPRNGGCEAIRTAVAEAVRLDVRTVIIPEGQWNLEKPVLLPDAVTLILWGASIKAKECAFINEKSSLPYALATEQKNIHILGFNGASIYSEDGYQISLCNLQHFSVSGITFAGGSGLHLRHARKGSVKQLAFSACLHGICMEEGCRELILEDIHAETQEEAVCWNGGETTVWGRGNEICQCIMSRVFAQTEGAPAIAIRQGNVQTENVILRDITDMTRGDGYSILLGDGDASLRGLTVRNLRSQRGTVDVSAVCDGVYINCYQGREGKIHPDATRVLRAAGTEEPRIPVLAATVAAQWISANDPQYRGMTDGETLQNAINAAAENKIPLVIPRYNARSCQTVWELEKTLTLPDDTTVVLVDAHLRMKDYTYCNMFCAENVTNVQLLGIGSALLDSGLPNGLKVKNAGCNGFGPIIDNALLRFNNVRNVCVEGFQICQSRWYGVYCAGSRKVNVRDIDFYAPPIYPDLGGVYLAGGCSDITVENITGMIGADAVLLDAKAKSGAGDIEAVHVSAMLANVSRCCMVRIVCHDGCRIKNVITEGIVDSSLPEQKKQPRAMVCVGQPEGWSVKPVEAGDLQQILVRDVCGRGASTVELGGKSSIVHIENIHSFGNTGCGLRSSPVPEVTEFILSETQEKLCAAFQKELTHLKACEVDGLFFRCLQASAYMRGTATSVITDKKKFVGTVIDLSGVSSDSVIVRNVFAEQVGTGVIVTGQAVVTVEKLQVAECGRELALCGSGCTLTVNGEACDITKSVVL